MSTHPLGSLFSRPVLFENIPPPPSVPPAQHARSPILSLCDAKRKMEKNAEKAIARHIPNFAESREVLATVGEVISRGKEDLPAMPLQLAWATQEVKGKRDQMEDASCVVSEKEGTLAAVFDGHGGPRVALFCRDKIASLFFSFLRDLQRSPHAAFEATFDALEREIEDNPTFDSSGTTAVVSFVDHVDKKIYTATIGDSEATIYRKIQGITKAIPISCLENWKTEKALKRYQRVMNLPSPLPENPKLMRYCEINLSRALGDRTEKLLHLDKGSLWRRMISNEGPSPLIHKCKITIQDLFPGDWVVLASDGLKDFMSEKEVVSLEDSEMNPKDMAERLVAYAFGQKSSSDNITAVVLSVLNLAMPSTLQK